jgi:putative ABC transport system permease protein
VLGALSVAITVTTIVAALAARAQVSAQARKIGGLSELSNPRTNRVNEVLLLVTIALIVLALVNVLFISWSTALDSRRALAVSRALGSTPRQISAGLTFAQLLPALPAAVIGIPVGLSLYAALNNGQGTFVPPTSWLIATVVGTLIAVALFSSVPARLSARRSVAEILQSDSA